MMAVARLTTLGLAAVVMMAPGMGCHGGGAGGAVPPTSAAGRAVLLQPTDRHWSQPAPQHFRVVVETTKGTFVLAIDRALAPRGVDRFHQLVTAGYFDDSRFFRVVPGFIAQFGIAGDPAIAQVWKDRAIADDSVRTSNVRGTIAFAMTGPNTRTTQLFVSLVETAGWTRRASRR